MSLSNGPVCEGEDLELTVTNLDTNLTYMWFDSIGNVLVATGPTLSFPNADASVNGTYFVVASQNGCESNPMDLSTGGGSSFVVAQVDEASRDIVALGDDIFICDDTITLAARQIFRGTGEWSLGDPDNNSFITRPNESSSLMANLEIGSNEFVYSIFSLSLIHI